jgi:hypothetical protein
MAMAHGSTKIFSHRGANSMSSSPLVIKKNTSLISHLYYYPSSFSPLYSIQSSSSSQPSFLMDCLGRPTITMVHFNFQGNFEHFLNFAKNN